MYPTCQKFLPSPLEGQLCRAGQGLSDTAVLPYTTLRRTSGVVFLPSCLVCLFGFVFPDSISAATVRESESARTLFCCICTGTWAANWLLRVYHRCTAVSFSCHPSPPAASPTSHSSCMSTSHGGPPLVANSIDTPLTFCKLPQWLLNSSHKPFCYTALFWNTYRQNVAWKTQRSPRYPSLSFCEDILYKCSALYPNQEIVTVQLTRLQTLLRFQHCFWRDHVTF